MNRIGEARYLNMEIREFARALLERARILRPGTATMDDGTRERNTALRLVENTLRQAIWVDMPIGFDQARLDALSAIMQTLALPKPEDADFQSHGTGGWSLVLLEVHRISAYGWLKPELRHSWAQPNIQIPPLNRPVQSSAADLGRKVLKAAVIGGALGAVWGLTHDGAAEKDK